MDMQRSRGYSRGGKAGQALKGVALVLAISAAGYVGIELGREAGPLLNASSGYALESRMMNPEALSSLHAERTDASGAVAATLEPSTSPAPSEFDYFPDHYVNASTRIEEQPPTF